MQSRNARIRDSGERHGNRASRVTHEPVDSKPLSRLPAEPDPITMQLDNTTACELYLRSRSTVFCVRHSTGQGTALSPRSVQAPQFPCPTTGAGGRFCVGTESKTSAHVPKRLAGGEA